MTEQIQIVVPTMDDPARESYTQRWVTGLQLSVPQSTTLRQLKRGLQAEGANLNNNRPVQSTADAIRWLLEEAARAMVIAAQSGAKPTVGG